jgi:hypothetical protein
VATLPPTERPFSAPTACSRVPWPCPVIAVDGAAQSALTGAHFTGEYKVSVTGQWSGLLTFFLLHFWTYEGMGILFGTNGVDWKSKMAARVAISGLEKPDRPIAWRPVLACRRPHIIEQSPDGPPFILECVVYKFKNINVYKLPMRCPKLNISAVCFSQFQGLPRGCG